MSIQKVALIFDNKTRPETTGVYCRRALGSLVEVEHFLPSELHRVPREGFDLYLNIDDGLDYHLPGDLRPSAWWAIDTHMNFDWCLTKARGFDFVFAAQRDGAEGLWQQGITTACWLPLAADPELHRPFEEEKIYDVCFVGNVFPGPRAELLRLIQQRFPDTFVGQRYFDDMAKTYSASKITFNRSIKNDVNMRVFEAVACRGFLLTNDLSDNGQAELFQDGLHLATYREPEDLLDKIEFYLLRDKLRQEIAGKGREAILARHTYRHRMEKVLEDVSKALGKGVPVASAAPDRIRSNAGQQHPLPERPNLDEGRPQMETGKDPSPPEGPPCSSIPKSDAHLTLSHDPAYFQFARPELLALIPTSARKILDIGCGAGRLGEAVKKRQPAEVVGIEMIESAVSLARERLDEVMVGDVETLTDRFQPASFDVIVCGDVLEHLKEPAALLRRARTWLKSDGRLVTSIPNVRHHSVVRGLLEGNWTYESAGLLDRDHLRFFTRREIEKMFFRAGFEVMEIQGVLGPGDKQPADQARTGRFNIGSLHLSGMRAEQIQEFFIYQYLVTARLEPIPDWGLTSIVILTHDELPYTRMCLDSIRLSTDEPYELIVVDNASTDGTVEYLQTLPEIKLIQNAQNLGFPKAVNQGIQRSTGRQILLLNNDCIVPTGWLRRMVRALHNDPKIALVGPCSNLVSGEQEVPVHYDDLSGLDGFAWDFGRAHDRNLEDTDRLVGFCLLIRKELIDEIGLLDERFGVGCFEDDDYCRRALLADFRVVIARDAFVHHFGGQTFRASGVDFAALMEKNRRLFDAKWSGGPIPPVRNRPLQPPNDPDSLNVVTTSQGNRVPPDPTEKEQGNKNGVNALRINSCQRSTVASLPSRACSSSLSPRWSPSSAYALRLDKGGGLLLVRQEIELSLCMIVRDNSRTIAAALKSIKPWVDEMIVVDTGSKDNTPKIAADLGARVFHFPWCDDFSAARNQSLQHARGRWLFWMDSDDTIDARNGRTLRELIRLANSSTLGFVVSVHCPGAGEEGQFDVTAVTHVKLFRNRPDLRFDGRIHEQILGAINLASGEVAWSDVFVLHSGYDHTPEGQKRKLERDLRILHLELKERPDHPFTLFNLGMTYTDMKDYRKGADFLQRSLNTSRETDSHLRKVYALLVYCYDQLELPNVAEETCRKGLERFPLDAELRFRQANLDHQAGRLAEAARRLQDLLKTKEEPHFLSYDRGIDGFKARQNLAVVYTDMGDLKKAEGEWRRVVTEVPHYRPGWRGLAENLLQQCKNNEAEELAKRLLQDKSLAVEGLILKSQLALHRGNLQSALGDLRRAVRDYPNNDRPLEALSQFLFEHGDLRDAENPLKQLVRLDPENPSAHHNLGMVYLRKDEFDAAAAAFRESLKHRANSAPTWFHLGNALKASERLQEAVDAWQQAHRLDPDNVEIQDALRESKAR